MIPRPAQYLLRFDDLCPTMEWHRWQRLRALVQEFGICPILAVIPENRDPEMEYSPADSDFWARMREMETAGSTIGAHGFHHTCKTCSKSLIGLHQKTEFAGLSLEVQRQRIHAGLQTLHDHGLNPRLWVAPRHTFDMTTLRAVREEGLGYISDGLARVPFTRGGVTWIPQQLWSPVNKSKGLWTICIHSNSLRETQFIGLELFLRTHAEQFTSFDRVVAEFEPAALGFTERLYEKYATWRLQMHRKRSRRRHQRGS